MIKITMSESRNVTYLDYHLRGLITSLDGVDGKHLLTTVNLHDNATQQDVDDATDALNDDGVLTIEASKLQIVADATPTDLTVITCAALPTNFDYVVWLKGQVSIEGSVSDGSLELGVVEVGMYTVEIRNPANWQTGYIEIEGI